MERAGRSVGPRLRDPSKITVVGAGGVGIAAAYAILIKNLGKPLVLLDVLEDKVKGEVEDFQHGLSFTESEGVIGGTDYSLSEGSKVCIITAGKKQHSGQSRMELLQDNFNIIKVIIQELIKYSPDAIFLIATNPADVLTYATWRMTDLPLNQVFGTGTHLDSSRFKRYLSEFADVPVRSIDAFIIGEHGETAVPVWSHVRLAGQPFSRYEELISPEVQEDIQNKVINSAQEVISLKGYTSSAIGLSIADIVEAIVYNKNKILCVSTMVKGEYGVEKEVFTSLPCMIGANGISNIIEIQLTDEENQRFHKSVENLIAAQDEIQQFLAG